MKEKRMTGQKVSLREDNKPWTCDTDPLYKLRDSRLSRAQSLKEEKANNALKEYVNKAYENVRVLYRCIQLFIEKDIYVSICINDEYVIGGSFFYSDMYGITRLDEDCMPTKPICGNECIDEVFPKGDYYIRYVLQSKGMSMENSFITIEPTSGKGSHFIKHLSHGSEELKLTLVDFTPSFYDMVSKAVEFVSKRY